MTVRPAYLGRLRGLAAVALLVGLAGCAGSESGGSFDRYDDLYRVALGLPLEPDGTAAGAAPSTLPPEIVDQLRVPTVGISVPDSGRTYLSAADGSEGYYIYQDQNRRGVKMTGGAVAGTYGFGIDLLAVRYQIDDPVAHPTPLAEWPGQVDREYQYRKRDLENYSITVACVFDRVVREHVEIVGRKYETVRILETCTNQTRSFENTYWVEPETGIIRLSEQWTGPQIRPVRIEVVRPAPLT